MKRHTPRAPVHLRDVSDHIHNRMSGKNGPVICHFRNGILQGVQYFSDYEHADAMPKNRGERKAS